MESTQNHPAATAKQLAFIGRLRTEREVPRTLLDLLDQANLDLRLASQTIQTLLNLPFKASTPIQATVTIRPDYSSLPPGDSRYALERDGRVRFYLVQRPTAGRWSGYTFAQEQRSEGHFKLAIDEQHAVLRLIAADPQGAAVLYGKTLGECSICARKLTDGDSIANGIGPICARKVGWQE